MNYREQGYRDRVAGAGLEECMYEPGAAAYAAWRAGWRDADDACGDEHEQPDLAPGPDDERMPLHLVITRPQKEQLLVEAKKWGGTMANYARHRLFRAGA